MRRRSATLIAALAAIALTQIASAADLPRKAPAYVEPPVIASYGWTGFYIGLNAGYGWGDQTFNFTTNDPFAGLALFMGPVAPVSFNKSGAVGGFQLGYNWQFNQAWLVGLEADFDFSDINGSGNSTNLATGGPQSMLQTANQKVHWFGTVRGRLGYLPTNNLLVYGTGGFAYGKVEQNANYYNNGPGGTGVFNGTCIPGLCYSGAFDHTAAGWTAGAGLEYAFLRNVTLKVEYLYINLGGNTFNENVLTGGTATSSFTAHYNDVAFHVVRGGINYRF
ncbi:MAG TPA: outer membrane protein [Bradyrhizobium sp.]